MTEVLWIGKITNYELPSSSSKCARASVFIVNYPNIQLLPESNYFSRNSIRFETFPHGDLEENVEALKLEHFQSAIRKYGRLLAYTPGVLFGKHFIFLLAQYKDIRFVL